MSPVSPNPAASRYTRALDLLGKIGDRRTVVKGSDGTPIRTRGTEDGWTNQGIRASRTALAEQPAVQARAMRPAPDSEVPTVSNPLEAGGRAGESDRMTSREPVDGLTDLGQSHQQRHKEGPDTLIRRLEISREISSSALPWPM